MEAVCQLRSHLETTMLFLQAAAVDAMPDSQYWLPVDSQFTLISVHRPVETGLLSRPIGPCHLCHITVCNTQATGKEGQYCLTAPIHSQFHQLFRMLMVLCTCSCGIKSRGQYVIVQLPPLIWQMGLAWTCPHEPMPLERLCYVLNEQL